MTRLSLQVIVCLSFVCAALGRSVFEGLDFYGDYPLDDVSGSDSEDSYQILPPTADSSPREKTYNTVADIDGLVRNATLDALTQLKASSRRLCGSKLLKEIQTSCYMYSMGARAFGSKQLHQILLSSQSGEQDKQVSKSDLQEVCCEAGCSGAMILSYCATLD